MPIGHDRSDSTRGSLFHVVDIITDVVKVGVSQEEEIERFFRVYGLEKVKECKAKLYSTEIVEQRDSWLVRVAFKVAVAYSDHRGQVQSLQRLVSFDKEVSFPPDCHICRKLKPRVDVESLRCNASAKGHSVLEVALRFQLLIKGVIKEEIKVVSPKNA